MVTDQTDNGEDLTASDSEVLKLALGMAERSIEIDLRSIDHHHLEIDRSLKLGLASLGAILVILGVFSTVRFVPDPVELPFLAIGVVLNIASIIGLVVTKTGLSSTKEAAVGPDLHELKGACKDPEWTVQGLQYSLLSEYGDYGDVNQEFLRSLTTGRRRGIWLWLAAFFLYLVGFSMIIAGELLG